MRIEYRRVVIGLLTLILALPLTAQAGVTVGATDVSSPQGDFGDSFPLVNIINHSGLSPDYTSGVTDFATYTAGVTGSTVITDTGFTDSDLVAPQQFSFDLGASLPIDAIALWNAGSPGGVDTFSFYADSDFDFTNGTTSLLISTTALPLTTSASVFPFSSTVTSRYFHL